VVLAYRPEKGKDSPCVRNMTNIWMEDRSLIADDRRIKKAIGESFLRTIPRHLKRNGTLELSEVYYLGWFRPKARGEK
jgi:hypothetical protein